MSNLLWISYPGQTRIETEEADEFDTTIARTVNGLEQRTIWQTSATNNIMLRVKARTGTNVPNTAPAAYLGLSEYAAVRKWFADHYGAGDSFLFDDNGTQVRVRFASDRLPRVKLAPGLYRFDITLVTV